MLLLAGLGALGSLSIHMFVPALPAVAQDLRSSESSIQLALTMYLLALGLGQLVAGPSSDVLGRRPVLFAGLALFTIGSVATALAQDTTVLVSGRIVQGLGGAAGIVAARTIVSDLTEPRHSAGRLALLTTVVLISPAVSPIVGGALTSAWGWRSIFVALTFLGLAAASVSLVMLRETRTTNGMGVRSLLPAYSRLIRNGRFRRYAIVLCGASCALYIFLAGSAFLLNRRYGLSPEEAGLFYLMIASAGIAGTLVVGALERRGGAIRIGLGAIVAGGALMMMMAAAGLDGLPALMGPMLLVGLGTGIAAPAGVAGAMHAEEGLAGTGSSLAGALQMSATGALTSIAAQLNSASLLSISVGICAAGLIALIAAPAGRTVNEHD